MNVNIQKLIILFSPLACLTLFVRESLMKLLANLKHGLTCEEAGSLLSLGVKLKLDACF